MVVVAPLLRHRWAWLLRALPHPCCSDWAASPSSPAAAAVADAVVKERGEEEVAEKQGLKQVNKNGELLQSLITHHK